jgi:hypothetical protein
MARLCAVLSSVTGRFAGMPVVFLEPNVFFIILNPCLVSLVPVEERECVQRPRQRPTVLRLRNLRFLRALLQFGKRAAGKAAKFGCRRVELVSMVGAAGLERGKPSAEAG